VDAQHRHGLAELVARDLAVAVLVPHPEHLDHVRALLAQRARDLLLHRHLHGHAAVVLELRLDAFPRPCPAAHAVLAPVPLHLA